MNRSLKANKVYAILNDTVWDDEDYVSIVGIYSDKKGAKEKMKECIKEIKTNIDFNNLELAPNSYDDGYIVEEYPDSFQIYLNGEYSRYHVGLYIDEKQLFLDKKRLEEKVNKFNDLCGDWDYRNIDMTVAHLGGIEINNKEITAIYERYDTTIDDYLRWSGEVVDIPDLFEDFTNLDLNNDDEVKDFMLYVSDWIDWDKVDKEFDEYIEEDIPTIVPATKLGEGWNWYKYSDGSGHLEAPNNKDYMSYDLTTNEYKPTPESHYEFFPLDKYYADGIKPSEFKPFEFMEEEMLNYVLPKEKDEEISL